MHTFLFTRSTLILLLFSLSLAGGCALYKPEIQQGNLITAEQVAQLKAGMSRAQVQGVLGSPLLADTFHINRWDYIYRVQRGGKVTETRKYSLVFEGDKLVSFSGDPQPSERDAAGLGQ